MSKCSVWFVYVVKCADGSFYCGSTTNTEMRVQEHNAGKGAKYTRSRTPVELVWFEPVKTKSEAFKRESVIKKMSRNEKLRLVGQ